MDTRVAAQGQSRLASSVHLVCRPRASKEVGDWRDVLSELPKRMHEWMPRLASEGVVGADAIFACLGPALDIFSRYSRVEKSNSDVVPLGDVKDDQGQVVTEGYLSHIWAAVAKEALSTIFRDADASGLDPDARLTAMWLWTLGASKPAANGNGTGATDDADQPADEPDEAEGSHGRPAKLRGFALEYDAARKIAQGLGVHLEKLPRLVEIKGDTARLLPVAERTRALFGKDDGKPPTAKGKGAARGKQPVQRDLFHEVSGLTQSGLFEDGRPAPGGDAAFAAGATVLDRVHQAMILFGAGRGEALKRFLVEDGIGKDDRFWKLAQSLSALYPGGTDEKRWVDGVLARKKGLGL
jgi:putative DNA methylase